MEKAIKLLNGYLSATLRIAEDYNKKARFELSEGNLKESELYKNWAERQLESAKEHEVAIDEIQKMLTLKSA